MMILTIVLSFLTTVLTVLGIAAIFQWHLVRTERGRTMRTRLDLRQSMFSNMETAEEKTEAAKVEKKQEFFSNSREGWGFGK
jgi:hypothetical protein